uniref:CCHC-type domain-containing protein n=1 Tax=Tanacetum cinerariifolium TaxID=118510 RepID=A0A6L2N0M6_TANCI|nr:hypothetical protein [Tanacetum cinerariifolium]
MMNRHHERLILESVENGPLIWPTIVENGVIRPKKYSELSTTEAIQSDCEPVALTTAEQKLARKNELKAYGTLQMALPDKHQLKFNSHKDAKTLMEAIEKRFGRNIETKKVQKTLLKQQYENFTEDVNLKFLRSLPSEWRTHTLIWRNKTDLEEQRLDDLFKSLKIYEAKVKSSSSTGISTQTIAFVPSSNIDITTEPVSAAASVSAVCAKMPVSPLLNVDSLSNDVIYSFFASQTSSLHLDNEDLKQIDDDDLEEMDLKWQMAMLTIRARRFLQRTGRNLRANRSTSMVFDMSKVECYNCHKKVHFARECSYDWSFQAEEEPTNYALMAFSSSSSSSDNESDESGPPSSLYDRFQSSDGYHVVPPPYTGTFIPPKPDLVFNSAPNGVETGHSAFNVKLSPTTPDQDLSHTYRPSAPIIEHWVSDSEDESETKAPQNVPSFVQPSKQVKTPRPSVQYVEASIPVATPKPASPKPTILTKSKPVSITAVRSVSTAEPKIKVTRPRHAKPLVTKTNSPTKRHINQSLSPKASNSPPRVTTVKALMVNAAQGLQGKWEWKPKCPVLDHVFRNTSASMTLKRFDYNDTLRRSKHMTENMSYLSDFEELNGRYVAFGGNPKGGKIFGKGKIRTGKLDFDDVYFVRELKFNLFNVSQMCDKKNSVLFTDTECHVLSFDFKLPDESQVLLRVLRENNMYNVNLKNIVPSGDLTCLFEKATIDESNLWHRRLGHINFKTINKLVKGKFDGKVDEGFLVRYSVSSKVFRVFNSRTRIVQETLHVNFLENKPNVAGSGPTWLFDIDSLTKTMNYQPVTAENQSNPSAGFQDKFGAKKAEEESDQQYALFPTWSFGSTNPHNTDGVGAFDEKEPEFDKKKHESEINVSPSSSAQSKKQDDKTKREANGKSPVESFMGYRNLSAEFEDYSDNNINEVNVAGTLVPTVGQISPNSTNTFSDADFNNLETSITVSLIPTTRVHRDHPVTQIIGDLSLATQTRSMTRVAKDQGGLSQMFNDDFHTCMFTSFLSQEEPKRVHQALKDPSWIEAMQEKLLQFKMQKVWILVDLPYGKRAIVARIEAIRLFLAYASFMGFMVYQMDVKSAFLYGTTEEEVYVCQPPGFEDPDLPDKVYKVVKALYGLHQAPRDWYETLANYLLENGFQRGKIDQTLFIKRQKGDILLVQIYVDDIIFGSTNKDLCKSFEKLMKDKFQMSSMGELTM